MSSNLLDPSILVRRARSVVPRFTSRFSDTFSVTAFDITSNIATITTDVDHNLLIGAEISLTTVLVRISIIAATVSPDSILFTTSAPHGLTAPYWSDDFNLPNRNLGFELIQLEGFTDTTLNGQQFLVENFLAVPSATQFRIQIPDGFGGSIILNGNENLVEDKAGGINGLWPVQSVPTTSSFTIDLTSNPYWNDWGIFGVPDQAIIGATVSVSRIDLVASIDRALAVYNHAKGDYLFVVITQQRTLPNPTTGDSGLTSGMGYWSIQRQLYNYSVYAFLDTVNDFAGKQAQQDAYQDIQLALNSCYLSYLLAENQTKSYLENITSQVDNGAFVVYRYDYEIELFVTNDQIPILEPTVPLRSITTNVDVFLDDETSGDTRTISEELP